MVSSPSLSFPHNVATNNKARLGKHKKNSLELDSQIMLALLSEQVTHSLDSILQLILGAMNTSERSQMAHQP